MGEFLCSSCMTSCPARHDSTCCALPLTPTHNSGKWARGWWAGSDEQEVALKEESGATLRCFPLEQPGGGGTCFLTGKPADQVALFAKAY